ncbi:MAG: 23S rRNA (adenine(2503)-C(2))-methyltransferase [Candidatus Aminicenantes bacterium RBG_13_63_10]|nr:MAG: 23S rRNA (adenine(2503)-C(2))-methyltransferase [Candidatus Aminicenantes bacterium RBG_13_63_10]
MDKQDIRDLEFDELRRELEAWGEPGFRAGQVFGWLYRRGARAFEDMSDLSRPLRERLAGRFVLDRPEEVEHLRDDDGAEKFLLKLGDDRLIETVLIPSPGRATVCVSSQVGCRFGCVFCASGMPGFTRNLTAAEITNQALHVREATGRPVTHVVFMGMGEPLDNWENTARSVRTLNSPAGLGIAARRILISTCGLLPGLESLKTLGLQVELAVSLHAATDELRNRLVPVNRKYPLDKLIPALRDYRRETGRLVTLEYVLIRGVNDSPTEADRLTALARRIGAKVNIIPCSPVPGLGFEPVSRQEAVAFVRRLNAGRIRAVLRKSKGGGIRAACGQLAGRAAVSPKRGT